MSEMIERVAKAIAKANDVNDELHWKGYLPEARAAIEAMREPTEEMKNIARINFETDSSVWEHMIGAALE